MKGEIKKASFLLYQALIVLSDVAHEESRLLFVECVACGCESSHHSLCLCSNHRALSCYLIRGHATYIKGKLTPRKHKLPLMHPHRFTYTHAQARKRTGHAYQHTCIEMNG